MLAWEDAAELFERALAALELAERPGPQQRCDLLLAVGEARMAASDVPAARTAYQQAGELARRIGSPEALARAGLGLGSEFTSGVVDPVQVGLLEEALTALGKADSPLRARVLAGLARALVSTPQVERRLALSEDAVQMARRLGDPATLAAVLFGRHLAAPCQQHLRQARGGQPRCGRRLRHPPRPGRIAASCHPAGPGQAAQSD